MKVIPNILDQYTRQMPGSNNGAALPLKKQTALPVAKKETAGGRTGIPTNTGKQRNTQAAHVAKITAPKGRKGLGKNNLGKTKKGFVD